MQLGVPPTWTCSLSRVPPRSWPPGLSSLASSLTTPYCPRVNLTTSSSTPLVNSQISGCSEVVKSVRGWGGRERERESPTCLQGVSPYTLSSSPTVFLWSPKSPGALGSPCLLLAGQPRGSIPFTSDGWALSLISQVSMRQWQCMH
jgi:hypothetical protein